MPYLNLGKYWHHAIREDGRVRLCYYGSGPEAALLAGMARAAAEERRQGRRERAEAEARERRTFELEADRGRGLVRLVAAGLEGLGFYRIGRTPWRRQRRMRPTVPARPAKSDPLPAPARKEVKALLGRVKAKEAGAYQELVRLAQAHPALVVEETAADLEWAARSVFASKNLKDAEFVLGHETQMDRLYRDLAGPDPSPALKLVVRMVQFAWSEHWMHSTIAAAREQSSSPMELRRQNAAQRRFVTAIKTYVQVSAFEGYLGARAAAARLTAAAAIEEDTNEQP
jgi:hypothetical protein